VKAKTSTSGVLIVEGGKTGQKHQKSMKWVISSQRAQ